MQGVHDLESDRTSNFAQNLGSQQVPDLTPATMIRKQLPNPSHVQLKEIISSYRKHQMMGSSTKLKGGLQ